ncbi:GNAT family N-acetyltransferase [Sphingomonas sp. PAMC 26617]|uniref:GNAT family N-acetyltransferase n=1 Tax=Sphingomonas sp. PAMC 26617 TaxID=1112216 RepID=UPI000289E418|nr:GNAT family protein [Sphingomonas sp. PAMC 26617]
MRDIPVLETARLRLRVRTADDAEALFPTLSDPVAMTYWSHAPFETVAAVRARFAEPFVTWRAWAITRHGSDTAIGFVAVGDKREGKVSEIGYMIDRAHGGAGLAREAVARVIDQLFVAEGQRRVFADTDPDNVRSNALLQSLGFTLEGRLRAEWETHIGVRDTFLWGLLATEWKTR